MNIELDILRDVTSRLSHAGFRYMLTGSFALNYYAQPRMTRDIDLVVELQMNDAERIACLFEDDYYIDRNAVSRAISNKTLFNLIHKEHVVKVDLIIRKDDEYRRTEFDRRQQIMTDAVNVWIVSKEDLIISKLSWARDSHSEFQLRDVRNLLKSTYDVEYVEYWAGRLGLRDLLEECADE
jgi:hypothetical protein